MIRLCRHSEKYLVSHDPVSYQFIVNPQFLCDDVGRHKPAKGVRIGIGEPTIVCVTVCSENRVPWIAQPQSHKLLVESWNEARAWLIGYYPLMPDHLHMFCAPNDLNVTFDTWMRYWKRLFTQKAQELSRQGERDGNSISWRFQSGHWDTRLRRSENYTEKWHYLRENPVEDGLVKNAAEWLYQGMLNVLQW